MKLKAILLSVVLMPAAAVAAEVDVDNFVRAETDNCFRSNLSTFGVGMGEIIHLREPANVKNQTVIRQNQDTIYSAVVLDLSTPVRVTLPEIDGRYQSMHVLNQDHYMFVESASGTYELTQEQVGSRFAMANFRTFFDPGVEGDLELVHAAQDGIVVEGGGAGPFEAPDWDQNTLEVARQALNTLATLGFNARYAFGSKDEVRPIDHLIGAASGWGGMPANAASYVLDSVDMNDGKRTTV